jgi:hypothetical protein
MTLFQFSNQQIETGYYFLNIKLQKFHTRIFSYTSVLLVSYPPALDFEVQLLPLDYELQLLPHRNPYKN